MEQNLPIVAKKLWHIVRVAYFMLRKGISKAKLTLELNLLLKRGKIASKSAMHNLVFHNIINHNNYFKTNTSPPQPSYSHGKNPIDEYEFSCSNTPAHHTFFNIPFHLKKRSRRAQQRVLSRGADDENFDQENIVVAGDDSPADYLPGFGKTPMVRQLRVSDSPFVLEGVSEEDVEHVDEAAEEFIMKFYKELKKQNIGMYA